ncbi:MAG: hypothetical protein NTZ34_12275 [Chloroflexi bacterium]|nr:hypothetical protein [Chloroflexota bacterium]
MALIRSIERRIRKIEGFRVVIKDKSGRDIRSDMAHLSNYQYSRKTRKDMTVQDWKRTKFNKQYPGYKVTVIDGPGNAVVGNTKIGTVRESYK